MVAGDILAGRYRLEHLLGEGGMGVVWAAIHTVTGRPVALKLMTADATTPEARRRFLREARAAAAVRHPNIIEIYDFFDLENGSPVMVMELLAGESLANRLEREVQIPLEEAASILLQVAAAVGSAHAVGIVHRDLKPENIFLAGGSIECVKVLDFGIAKLIPSEGAAARSTNLTESGTLLGTPCYMAPEQVFGERDIDHRADIWALGIILYECLSGVLPTRADNVGQIFRIIATGTIPPLADRIADIPPEVAGLVDRMLSRERDTRPPDLREVADVLARHVGPSGPSFGLLPAPAMVSPEPAADGESRQVVIYGEQDCEPLAATKSVQGAARAEAPRSAEVMTPPLPAPNNLPLRRLFAGREDELARLDEVLERKQRASLFALGGMGKTALALEYAHRAMERSAYPGGVWWISAEGHPIEAMIKLVAALRTAAPALLAGVRPEAPAEEQAEAARIVLQNQPLRSLLVLDDVSEQGLLDRLPGGAVRVLATLRDRRLSLGEPVELEPLDPGDARAVVEALVGSPGRADEAEACDRVVSQRIGGLAVAVEVAAKAAKEWAGGWVAYERYLTGQMAEALNDERDRSDHYPRGVFAALDLSIERCAPGSSEQKLLVGAAEFAPDAVPLVWASLTADLDPKDIDAKRARATLESLGLIKFDRETRTLSMHPLVHKRVEHKVDKGTWTARICRGVDVVDAWIADAVGRTQIQTEKMDTRRPHIERALGAAERTGRVRQWVRIADQLARHLRYCARYEESRLLSERALEKTLSLEMPDLEQAVLSLSNMALTLQAMGAAVKAVALLEHAIDITDNLFGPDHPNMATRLSNLARVLPDVREANQARPLLEHALAIAEETFGPDHRNVAKCLSNLAVMWMYVGEPNKARALLERAVILAEQTHGAGHPSTATVISNLATALRSLGEADRARPLLERALALDEASYGSDHRQVAKSLSKLAAVLRELGQANKARPLLERAVAIDEKTYGPDHATVAQSLTKLLAVLRDLGEEKAARRVFKRIRRIDERTSAPNLRDTTTLTALTLQEAAGVQAPRQDVEGALERSLAIAEEIYGPDHPVVAAILSNLANNLLSGERAPDQVKALFERSLVINEKAYGPDHPKVAMSLLRLGLVLKHRGEKRKARPLLERSLAVFEKTHGPTHWDVAFTLSHLAMMLKDARETEKARPLFERAAAIVEELYGPHHPFVKWNLSNLAAVLEDLGKKDQARIVLQRLASLRE
jgi:serine/threonine-protein kinase